MSVIEPVVSPVFGRLVSALQVEDAMQATVQKWIVTYLAEVERQHGMAPRSLPDIRSYQTFAAFDHWPENQLPACVIHCAGYMEPATRRGDGIVDASFNVAVVTLVSGMDEGSTRRLVMLYADAVRGAVGQHQSLGDVADRCIVTDERYDVIPTNDARTLAASQVTFRVDIDNVMNAYLGPQDVPADPYVTPDELPLVTQVLVDVEKVATDVALADVSQPPIDVDPKPPGWAKGRTDGKR